jgi:hypothetical protein
MHRLTDKGTLSLSEARTMEAVNTSSSPLSLYVRLRCNDLTSVDMERHMMCARLSGNEGNEMLRLRAADIKTV